MDEDVGDGHDTAIAYMDDDIGDARHKELDKAVLEDGMLSIINGCNQEPAFWFLLNVIVENSDDKMDGKFVHKKLAKDFLKGHDDVTVLLKKAWEAKDFKAIRLLKDLRPQETQDLDAKIWNEGPQEKATEKAWSVGFEGQSANDLWNFIQHAFFHAILETYARYTAIVQSSGMGKSRTVDEMSKEHFVIPMCLREDRTTGYPPPDKLVRDYLCERNSKNATYNLAVAFLCALFEHTAHEVDEMRRLENLASVQVPAAFRLRMTDGQTNEKCNQYRSQFFCVVINKAKGMINDLPKSPSPGSSPSAKDNLLADCFVKLAVALSKQVPPRETVEPLVVLAFDEAHVLSQVYAENWSIFGEMRRALRLLNNSSVFTVFLSTTGKITQFVPMKANDISARVVREDLELIAPFSDLGFDSLVQPIPFNVLTIKEIAQEDFMVQLGRPLFASRYTEGAEVVKENIVHFAAFKLLNGTPLKIENELSRHQQLACLSQRVPIQFFTTNYLDEDQMRQVEGHMRVCLRIDGSVQSMTSVSSSEPLLSEAAFAIMQRTNFHAATALKLVFSGFAVDKGDKGEFIGLLLMILARDAAVCAQNHDKSMYDSKGLLSYKWDRVVPVVDLMKQLFAWDKLFVESMEEEDVDLRQGFEKDFENSVFYFNHFIKGHDHKVVQRDNLSRFLMRGAGLLCGNSQKGIDAIVPILRNKTACISKWIIDLCLVQFKADSSYTATPKWHLNDQMNPYDLDIVSEKDEPPNCIRIVFALAARKPSLKIRKKTLQSPQMKEYVCYDIWCAGLDSKLLCPTTTTKGKDPIEHEKDNPWASLLQLANSWSDMYKSDGKWVHARAYQNPLAGSDQSFHNWCRRKDETIADRARDEIEPKPVTSHGNDMDVDEYT